MSAKEASASTKYILKLEYLESFVNSFPSWQFFGKLISNLEVILRIKFIRAAHANLNKSQAYIFMRNNFSIVPWLKG